MPTFNRDKGFRRSTGKKWLIIVPLALIVLTVAVSVLWYTQNLKPFSPSSSDVEHVFIVEQGVTDDDLGGALEDAKLIQSSLAFRLYVRISGNQGMVQAGSYSLSPQMTVQEIVDILVSGKVNTELVTILPAQRLEQIEESFLEAGYSSQEVIEALDPDNYSGHPVLVDKPPVATLEGYLYPESFQVTESTPLQAVIEQSLDQLDEAFTDEVKESLRVRHGLTLHEAIILASIVEREVSNPADRTKVAQVFLKRYKENISLGSDPTALYGALLFGIEPSVFADTPYNTRLYAGLPPGPINNVSADSLRAVAFPASTDFLFFVSGDDGNTYFSNTQAEHEALTAEHCIELCRSY